MHRQNLGEMLIAANFIDDVPRREEPIDQVWVRLEKILPTVAREGAHRAER